MVPAVSEVCRRQALHWNSWRDLIALWRRSPQIGLEALGPAPAEQRLAARGFSAVLLLELRFAEPLLELH